MLLPPNLRTTLPHICTCYLSGYLHTQLITPLFIYKTTKMTKDSADLCSSAHKTTPLRKQPSLLDRLLGNRPPKSPTPSPQNSSAESLPPLGNLVLKGYAEHSKRRLLDQELAANIRNLIPPRLQLFGEWELLYSLEQHGISLNTLYHNCDPNYQKQQLRMKRTGQKVEKGFAEGVVSGMVSFGTQERNLGSRPHGYVIVIQDQKKNKFGCYINEHPRVTDHKRYYGNGECFLWKCEWFDAPAEDGTRPHRQERFKAFMYTGINDNIIYSNHDFISVGSSHGQNGLWLDKSLDLGVSYPCETFGNEILNEHGDTGHKFGKFKIISLEVWRVGELE